MSKRPLAAILVVLSASLSGVVGACNEGGKPPVGPIVIRASFADGGADVDGRAADADGGAHAALLARSGAALDRADGGINASPEFYACTVDSDCVAVPKVGCCANGYKEALNAKFVDAYKASFICPAPNLACPDIMVNDTREPECNGEVHSCGLVAVKSIKCGGLIKNAHQCPEGTRCVRNRLPDLPGTCQP